jgi:hypothetical protein
MAKSKQQIIEELRAELAEAKKKPEPGEFTKKWRYLLSRNTRLDLTSSLEACDIIDRLTAENGKQKELICKECGSDACSTKAGCPFEQALKGDVKDG